MSPNKKNEKQDAQRFLLKEKIAARGYATVSFLWRICMTCFYPRQSKQNPPNKQELGSFLIAQKSNLTSTN